MGTLHLVFVENGGLSVPGIPSEMKGFFTSRTSLILGSKQERDVKINKVSSIDFLAILCFDKLRKFVLSDFIDPSINLKVHDREFGYSNISNLNSLEGIEMKNKNIEKYLKDVEKMVYEIPNSWVSSVFRSEFGM